jgi:aryl-alcohol dehydrogenase-like predicted oxidoreductase
LDLGFTAVEELKTHFSAAQDLASQALRWILMHRQVSTVIPGASTVAQVSQNIRAGQLPPLSPNQMQEATRIYEQYIKAEVHSLW